MRKQHWLLLLTLLLMLTMVACSGSSEEQPDGDDDGDNEVTEDGDGEEDGDLEEDGDVEEDGDDECTCTEENNCCDGCNPINEDGNCDDGNACTQTDSCKAGVCVGTDEVVCEAGLCKTDGLCNTESGECEYTEADKGTACEADEGIMGSGICLDGECGGFGSCNSRKYDQESGYACNYDSECSGEICYAYNEWFKYCTQKCGEGEEACPMGMKCVNHGGELGSFCEVFEDYWSGSPLTLPADGSNQLYEVCNFASDCEGGLCLVSGDGVSFCSMDCSKDDGASPDGALCGSCGSCEAPGEGSSIDVPFYCSMEGKNEAGMPCESGLDCEGGFCLNNYCSELCFDAGGVNTCPDGYDCVPGIYNAAICVHESESEDILKPIGGACEEDRWCISKMCRDGICSANCLEEACDEGTCVTTDTPIEVNTKIDLYKDGVVEAIASDDNSGMGYFSKLTYDFTESGTYYIDVYGAYSSSEGVYYLLFNAGDATGATEVDEVEPNNDKDNAMQLTGNNVKVSAMLDDGEHDFFAIEVTVAPVKLELVIETSPEFEHVCAADDSVAGQAYGASCTDTYQCADDRICFEGSCTELCSEDTDCPNGICFPYFQDQSLCVAENLIGTLADGEPCYINYQCEELCLRETDAAIYCSRECTSNDDCAYGMGCDQGYCIRGNGVTYPYNNCRFDADCDTGKSCIDSKCTVPCDNDEDCEGSEAFVAEEFGVCWTCETSADCNADGEDSPNICLNSPNGTSFCSIPCDASPALCPENTRCFDIGSFFPQHVCAPVSLSCSGQVSCQGATDEEVCTRPTLVVNQPCEDAAYCWSSICENGLCQEDSCSDDADCGCDYLACDGNYCAVSAGDDVAEVEPNNELADAQVISDAPAVVVSSFAPVDGVADVDLYKVSLSAGEFLDVQTKSFCEFAADTSIRLLDDQGVLIEGWENDDIDPNGNYFSLLMGYKATTSQDVIVEVTQSVYVNGLLNAGYLLDINVFTPDNNTTCDNALELTTGEYTGDFNAATHDYLAGACAGYSAGGKDLTYSFTLADDTILSVELDADFYVQVSLVTDCADIEKSCLDGITLTEPGTVPVEAKWANESGAEVEVLIIVDSWITDLEPEFTLNLTTTAIVEPENNLGENAIVVPDGSNSFDISTYGATNDYDPGADGCGSKALPGRDVVYTFDLDVGEFIIAKTTGEYTADMMLVTDYDDLSSCIMAASGTLVYTEEESSKVIDGDTATTYYLIVDSANEENLGSLEIDFTIDTTGYCSGPCDPATHEEACEGNKEIIPNILCKCDSSINMYEKYSCSDYCTDNAYIGGVCQFVDLEDGYDGCVCESDCANVAEQCTMENGGIYTNCTCAASDPCGWKDDNQCDAKCAAWYPDDHFDDSADCATTK